MAKGQEGSEAQEPKLSNEDEELIGKFKAISIERILREFEAKRRDEIGSSSLYVRDAFDRKWKALTGKPYFQAITTVKQVFSPTDGRNDLQRGDPKSMNYREDLRFSKVSWQKIRRRIGKKLTDLYLIDGTVKDTGTVRPIYRNLALDQLYRIFGDKLAAEIVADSKKEDRGEKDVDIDLSIEAFWEVQFAPQKDQYDTKDVRLTVEDVCLRFLRMIPVIVNGYHLENADHATKDIYTHEPNKGRQVVGKVQKYPYTVLRKASMEEFLAQKEAGNAQQREAERREEEA